MATHSNYQSVARCCWRSLEAGVRPGMTLAHARALVPGAIVEEHNPGADRQAMRRLAEWCSTRYAPIVSPDPCNLEGTPETHPTFSPDGLVMDISGCSRLFKGEHRLAFEIASSLRRLGLESRVGIAPTLGAAWAIARFGSCPFAAIPSEAGIRESLSPLPPASLRIGPEGERALTELGVERVEQLLALPRSALPSRFGHGLLLRIDQALGGAIEPIEPVRPAPPVRVELKFDGPTPQQEAVERATRDLLEELARELLRRESGVRVVEARFERVGANGRGTEIATERLTLARATRSARHLWSLLRPRVERLHLGFGIESIALVAVRTVRARHEQMVYGEERHRGSEASRHEEEGRLIDTLTNRLGPERVSRVAPVESHIPERSWRLVPAVEDRPGECRTAVAQRGRSAARRAKLAAAPSPPPPRPFTRPTTLFEAPEAAEAVALPDRPPTVLRWRAQELEVRAGAGPERLACEWWKQRPAAGPPGRSESWERDYFRVRDQHGRWLWIFREQPLVPVSGGRAGPPARWFVHGLWS